MSAALQPPSSSDQYHYQVNDAIRNLTSQDLQFICQYTGKSEDAIRPHIPEVWRKIKEQVPFSTLLLQGIRTHGQHAKRGYECNISRALINASHYCKTGRTLLCKGLIYSLQVVLYTILGCTAVLGVQMHPRAVLSSATHLSTSILQHCQGCTAATE